MTFRSIEIQKDKEFPAMEDVAENFPHCVKWETKIIFSWRELFDLIKSRAVTIRCSIPMSNSVGEAYPSASCLIDGRPSYEQYFRDHHNHRVEAKA